MQKLEIDQSRSYETALVFILVSSVVVMFFPSSFLHYAAPALSLAALISWKIFRAPARFWFGLAIVLNKVVSPLLLGAVYFVFLVPLAFLSRGFYGLTISKSNTKNSMFKEINHVYSKSDLEKPY